MEKFEVILKNSKLKRYHLSGWLLIFLNVAAQLIYTYKNPEKFERLLFFLAAGICLALFIIDRVGNFKNKKNMQA